MRDKKVLIASVSLISFVIVAIVAVTIAYAPQPQSPERVTSYSRVVSGQQDFVIGPNLCNLTWAVKLNNTAHEYYWEHGQRYVHDYSYTSLLSVNVTLTLREIGSTTYNLTQTIFIEPEVQPLGKMTRNAASFQLLWNGNITDRYENFPPYENGWDVWAFPTLTFRMPYCVANTTASGIFSFVIASWFHTYGGHTDTVTR